MRISVLISILSHVPIYITTLYCLAIYKKLTRELQIFSWFLFVTGIIQFTSLLLALKGINNMPLLHLYVAAGFFLLALFYAAVLNNYIDKRIIHITGILFLIFTVINSVFVQSIFAFNSYALTIQSILVIILSLSTYMLFLNDVMKETMRDLRTINWINSGLFIYYVSNLLIYYFGSIITSSFSRNFNLYTWVLHSFFSVVMYTCFFIGLWKRPKN